MQAAAGTMRTGGRQALRGHRAGVLGWVLRSWRRSGIAVTVLAGLCGLILASCAAPPPSVSVFAAASLSGSLEEIRGDYSRVSRDVVVLNLGGSQLLARQVEAGAPADVFFSADEATMDGLEQRGLVLNGTRSSRLSNALVVVAATEARPRMERLEDLMQPGVRRIAIGDWRSAPAGAYAKAVLERRGLWERVESRLLLAENVRAALAVVEAGNAELGMVYRTDARISDRVRVVYEVPDEPGVAISYPVAVLKGARSVEAAARFVEYLGSRAAAAVFERHGFAVNARP